MKRREGGRGRKGREKEKGRNLLTGKKNQQSITERE